MLVAMTPIGTGLAVPERLEEDRAYFRIDELVAARGYYETEGYVVLRGIVPAALCDRIRESFEREVRGSPTPILRQQEMRYERNCFDANGFLNNPIFNIQDLETRRFGAFKAAALDALTHAPVARAVSVLLADGPEPEPAKIIQSMFFEGGVGTWPHQDSYYQDSARRIGGGIAGWFALEDVDAGAGRFYVLPGSHRRMPVIRNSGKLDFAFHHASYKRAVLEAAAAHGFEWRAPYLAKGDVLFWNSCTVHGSLSPIVERKASRTSLTAHYLQQSDEMRQFHARVRRQKTRLHNGMSVALLHDQDRWPNRLAREIASRYPEAWATARRVAIRTLLVVADWRRRDRSPVAEPEQPVPAPPRDWPSGSGP